MKRSVLLSLALALVVLAAGRAAAAPRVVASVAPVHALVAAVMQGVGEPELLVAAGSPHTHSLRPSEAAALADADLVVWVGPELETFLARPLDTLGEEATLLQLGELPGLRYPERHEDDERDGQQGHGAEEAEEHAHDEEGRDPHVWLDPLNTATIVRAVADELAALDPGRSATYRANAERALERIDALDDELARTLGPVAGRPFVVFHDAYGHFAEHYRLDVVAVVSIAPDRAPGAARLRQVRARIVATGAACVFAEPQFDTDVVTVATEGTGARAGTLDPLGTGFAPGPDLYFGMMQDLGRSIADCLSATD